MSNFKKVCRLYRLTGTFKLMLSGFLGLFFAQEMFSAVCFINPEGAESAEWNFVANIQYFNWIWFVMIMGNLDVGGKTRLLYTSKLRRYIYSRFYPGTGFITMLAMFLLDFGVKCILGNITGIPTFIWGGRSIMNAIFMGLGFLVMGLLPVFGTAAGVILLIGTVIAMLVFGFGVKVDIAAYVPAEITGNGFIVFLIGAVIILLGAAAFSLLRERGYRKASSPVSGAAKEQAAIEMIYRK